MHRTPTLTPTVSYEEDRASSLSPTGSARAHSHPGGNPGSDGEDSQEDGCVSNPRLVSVLWIIGSLFFVAGSILSFWQAGRR